MIDKKNITWGELEERAKAGDKEAIEYIEEFEKEMAPMIKPAMEALKTLVDGFFEDHPSKPFFEMLKTLQRSKNPVHRAFARAMDDWSLKEIHEKGARYLEEELSKSANDLPPKVNVSGKYDWLCKKWVNRPSIPHKNKSEFLYEHAPELTNKTFDRILKDAKERGVIRKNDKGRYVPN